jgi:hypothetical protein
MNQADISVGPNDPNIHTWVKKKSVQVIQQLASTNQEKFFQTAVNLHDFTRLNQCEALEHQAGQNC